jgi:predicted secreted acid phosphatase
VKKTIYAYYGDPTGTGQANPTDSPYIREMSGIIARERLQLPRLLADAKRHHQQPAIVFDADDTTLWTYQMEVGDMKFVFTPAAQAPWVDGERFPATPGMVDFVNDAQKMGFTVFGLTGRSDSQKTHTLNNLAKVGYTAFTPDHYFTKYNSGTTPPAYLTCVAAPTCTTVEYKAGTRKHIEQDLGYDVVLNVGDQFSDLQGGYALKPVKLPNPTYYLPSPNIEGAPASDSGLTPRTTFTMAPDGSSGAQADGEGIPNIDSVKSTIRSYYGATDPANPGIADKESSRYISEMDTIADKWAPKLRQTCRSRAAAGDRPAVVFDADDTTLWTYDMEDAAMKFNFDPALQNVWVQEQRFPATPKMPRVVRAAKKGGCKIVGLTGRNNDQRDATLDNLAKFYTDKATGKRLFKSKFYFTKWTSAQQPPAYVDCSLDGDATKCSTIEYKSSTRKYVERHLKLDVVANFGDQFSDLIGGHSDKVVKLPNPTYYLP